MISAPLFTPVWTFGDTVAENVRVRAPQLDGSSDNETAHYS